MTKDTQNKVEPSKRNHVPIILLIAVIIGGTFAIIFANNTKAEDISPKVDVTDLEVIKKSVPALDESLGWLNTEGIAKKKLDSSVVIYDFWTYSCINCQRTLPYLRAIYDRYEKEGLIIVGIHSPEFDFEKVHSNIDNAAKKYKVNWPVLYDDNMKNWDKFQNQYWPAKYITDKKGQLRYSHFGEGRYEETEDVIRELLGVDKNAPRANLPGEKKKVQTVQITPEIYLGFTRGSSNAKAGKQVIDEAVVPGLDKATFFGSIDMQSERTVLQEENTKLILNYTAAQVNLVAENINSDKTILTKLKVELNGKAIPKDMRGKEVKEDSEGNTYIDITSPDLVNVIDASKVSQGILTFTSLQTNIALYAFTFGA
jgi:thiol-disulfide isomerase/thioredoxin